MDDLISRSALLKKAQALLTFDGKEVVWVRDDVLLAPSIEVAPVVHGRWIELGFSTDEPYGFICSICNGDVLASKMCPITDVKFCPSCGAKMDKEEPT